MMLRILMNTIKNRVRRVRNQVFWEQYFFLKGREYAIFDIKIILERMIEKRTNASLCFIDYEKTSVKVRHEEPMTMLEDLHIDGKEMRLVRNLCILESDS